MLSVILLPILMIPLSALDVTRASDLWQQLELPSELESDLEDTMGWGKKWFVDFNPEQTELVSFDHSNNTGVLDVKMDESVTEEKWLFKMLGVDFLF